MPRKPRITVPGNPEDLIMLAKKVLARHQELKQDSPLRLLEAPNWDTHGEAVTSAAQLQAQIDQMEKDLKTLYGQRQQQLDILLPTLRKTRDMLTGVYASNLRRLGEFGFEVLESPAPTPTAKASAAKAPKA